MFSYSASHWSSYTLFVRTSHLDSTSEIRSVQPWLTKRKHPDFVQHSEAMPEKFDHKTFRYKTGLIV